MGLDYMLKRRVAESPLNKLVSARDIFRDLLSNEFQLIKLIEDLKRIKDEIEQCDSKITDLENKLQSLTDEANNLTSEKENLEKEVEEMENRGEVRVYRDYKINFQSIELEIGHQINPLKKNFRILSSKGGAISSIGSFEIGIAKQYEDNVSGTFHSDAENEFKMLKSLTETLIVNADALKIKANHVHRLKQLQQSIESEKLKKLHEKSGEISQKMKELEKDPKLIENVNIIENKRSIIDRKSEQITKLDEQSEMVKSEINDEKKSEEEKQTRFTELKDESLRLDLEKK
jgi:chromosome segregation ATPase